MGIGTIVAILFFVLVVLLLNRSGKRQAAAAIAKKKESYKPFIHRHFQIITESHEIIKKSPNLKTILSRYDVIFENIGYLVPYETEFPDLFSPTTKEMRDTFEKDKPITLLRFALNSADNEIGRANAVTRKSTKVACLDKALLSLYEVKKEIPDPPALSEIAEKEATIRDMISSLE